MPQQLFRVHWRVVNGVEQLNEITGELEIKDFLLSSAPVTAAQAERVMASLLLEDDVEDIELTEE